ncbi:2-succinyl-5-enolpyruvyl-6-hydroxy-3-cyclohexene-1-carboxylic-acid synthase [Aequorivita antarctica]|uniref:2-succinyl-5-enolpyruvyl-6-hydroxy-3-cyclohexene-1-carboxylate synthase n=1 Tax=Aequorivita antarctica TaxID=153266 RepID=A0A5C6Z3M7_9FLAO|nr:2-succinyl-5-enolpyruvyl-6-hydroxy-3-cyclohexene-1-carboxylic-acid synthase [Aequorivita antarctica]TXD74192.1 2-succinyl-5-enolpyruvyl-6-hydroxy-3-cyclohexene-1-carboxylic-acid synthase [Aequorivita antarctica]SRX75954.1 2-succinyl-5-enolpyruvyl-6-hydroxy-3-cyclohexene-1-carboxylate synthase [Aequorivita antarctica]
MKFSNKILSQTLVQLCFDKGIEHIVISPGSRNAPLTIGFGEHPDFKCFSIVDERCAAFFALGMAQQIKKPVAVICTSGSALLNYYPAVAEAFYSDIPLVVIAADRPLDRIDIGDGQTIRQQNVFENHILYSANCIEGEEFQIKNETEINIALNTAIELNGPVHINIPFTEPLYHTTESQLVWPQNVIPRMDVETLKEDLNPFIKQWSSSKRKIVLVGVLPPNSLEQRFVEQLAKDESVLVLTETTSNLHNINFISAIDQLIAPLTDEDFKKLQPDILLTFGGMVVSKKIKAFLRSFSPREHWHVDSKKAYDTFFVLKHHFKTSINSFLAEFLLKTVPVQTDYRNQWLAIKRHRLQRHETYVSEIPYADFMVFSEIFKQLPQNVQLQLSNSATIRYAQLFDINTSAKVFCNRGTSGIDGSTSTAVGAAYASKLPTVFLTGDLSFFYDSNALWNNYIPKNFKIVVVNNGGGGIFRILPGEKDTELFDTFFETKHNLSAKQLSEMYGFKYQTIFKKEELLEKVNDFFSKNDGPALLEIFTPSTVNDKVLLDYFKFIL